jgi:hypothetical protein
MTGVHATIENVSRQGFLKGLLATGGLVVAAEFVPVRGALAAYATGAAKLPGMRYAVIARPPVMGGKLASYDGSTAMKVPGVEKIIVIEGTPLPSKFQPICGVAVIALNCPEAPIR